MSSSTIAFFPSCSTPPGQHHFIRLNFFFVPRAPISMTLLSVFLATAAGFPSNKPLCCMVAVFFGPQRGWISSAVDAPAWPFFLPTKTDSLRQLPLCGPQLGPRFTVDPLFQFGGHSSPTLFLVRRVCVVAHAGRCVQSPLGIYFPFLPFLCTRPPVFPFRPYDKSRKDGPPPLPASFDNCGWAFRTLGRSIGSIFAILLLCNSLSQR